MNRLQRQTRCTTRAAPSLERAEPFVGRDRALATLGDALADSRRQATVTALVRGLSGSGKTSLLRHFMSRLSSDVLVLAGRCDDNEIIAHSAIDSAIDALSEHLVTLSWRDEAAMPDGIAELARAFPVLRRVPAVATAFSRAELEPDVQDARRLAAEALRDLIGQLAEQRPLVLVIDDLQWGDLDSAPFLTELMASETAPGALLVFGARSEEIAGNPLLQRLLAPPADPTGRPIRTVDLGPLTESEAAALAMELLDGHVDESARRIARESAGNPFWTVELARHWQQHRGQTMTNLRTLLENRIQRLPRDTRRLLHAVALAGRPRPLHLLGRAQQIANEAKILARLEAAKLVRSRYDGEREGVEIYHAHIREIVLATLSASELRTIHRSLARALEREPEPDLEGLIEHWRGAGQARRARTYAIQAAERARRALSFLQAADLFAVALNLPDSTGDRAGEDRRSLLVQRAECLSWAGSIEQAARTYEDAADLVPQGSGDSEQASELRRQALLCRLRAGCMDTAYTPLARQILADVGVRLPRTSLGAMAMILVNRFGGTRRILRAQPRRHHLSEARLQRLRAGYAVSMSLAYNWPLAGVAVNTTLLRRLLREFEPELAARTLVLQAGYHIALRGYRGQPMAHSFLARARDMADQAGVHELLPIATGVEGMLYLSTMNNLVRGCELLEASVAAVRHHPEYRWERNSLQSLHLVGLYFSGQYGKLSQTFPRLFRTATQRGDEDLAASVAVQSGIVADLCRGQLDQSRERHELLWARFKDRVSRVLHFAHGYNNTLIELYRGDLRQAHDALTRRYRRFMLPGALLAPMMARSYLELLAQTTVALATAPGTSRRERKRLLRAAARHVALLKRIPLASAAANSHHIEAALALARGQKSRAEGLYRSAIQAQNHMGFLGMAQAVRYRLGQLLGGAQGRAHCAEARTFFEAQSVQDPEPFIAMLCPASTDQASHSRTPGFMFADDRQP